MVTLDTVCACGHVFMCVHMHMCVCVTGRHSNLLYGNPSSLISSHPFGPGTMAHEKSYFPIWAALPQDPGPVSHFSSCYEESVSLENQC